MKKEMMQAILKLICGTAIARGLTGVGMTLGLLAAGPASANLLVNGSAETGDIAPWVATANGSSITDADAVDAVKSVIIAQDNKPLSAFDGTRFFSVSEAGAGAAGNQFIMTQTGALPANASLLSLSGMFASEFEDFGAAALAIYDAASNPLAEVSVTNLNNALDGDNDFTWTAFGLGLAVLPAAASWEVKLTGELVTGGNINVYWDQLALDVQAVPEPGTLVLFGFGLAGLGLMGWRKAAV